MKKSLSEGIYKRGRIRAEQNAAYEQKAEYE